MVKNIRTSVRFDTYIHTFDGRTALRSLYRAAYNTSW